MDAQILKDAVISSKYCADRLCNLFAQAIVDKDLKNAKILKSLLTKTSALEHRLQTLLAAARNSESE